MSVGLPASSLGAFSLMPFVAAGNGSVPTGELSVGYGEFTLTADTPLDVVDPYVTSTSIIALSLVTVGGTVGAIPAIQTTTAGTGFNVVGDSGDTSVYNYLRLG